MLMMLREANSATMKSNVKPLALCLIALLFAPATEAHHRFLKKYDRAFQSAQHRYAPMPIKRDWKLLKAQCLTESGLDPLAVSHSGAKGLCQFMPAAWEDWGQAGTSPFNARAAIKASARYMRWQWSQWSLRKRPLSCQQELSLAAYNAGLGNVLRAQTETEDALCWNEIQKHLQEVTGDRATETSNYVKRNREAYHRLNGKLIWQTNNNEVTQQ